jgi:hypothetical protein
MAQQTQANANNLIFSERSVVGKRSRWNRLTLDSAGERLHSALETYYLEMAHLETLARIAGLRPEELGFDSLNRLLEKSAEALRKGQLELGWNAFNAAQRIEIHIYSTLRGHKAFEPLARGIFTARAERILKESRKLGGWRKDTVAQLLGKDDQLKPNLELSALLEAHQVLAENYDNIYRRLKIIRGQFIWLVAMAAAAIVGWFWFLVQERYLLKTSEIVYDPRLSISALLFGVLGACISGILQLANTSMRENIPQKMHNAWSVLARPLVGAVSGLVVVVFILVGILDLGGLTPGMYLAAAFSAGFSERLLLRGLGGSEPAKPEEKK